MKHTLSCEINTQVGGHHLHCKCPCHDKQKPSEKKVEPKCTCYEYIGDNPKCPVPEHKIG